MDKKRHQARGTGSCTGKTIFEGAVYESLAEEVLDVGVDMRALTAEATLKKTQKIEISK